MKTFISIILITFLFASLDSSAARCNSKRVGGYTSHGKGSKYIGGTPNHQKCKKRLHSHKRNISDLNLDKFVY